MKDRAYFAKMLTNFHTAPPWPPKDNPSKNHQIRVGHMIERAIAPSIAEEQRKRWTQAPELLGV